MAPLLSANLFLDVISAVAHYVWEIVDMDEVENFDLLKELPFYKDSSEWVRRKADDALDFASMLTVPRYRERAFCILRMIFQLPIYNKTAVRSLERWLRALERTVARQSA